jgi:F-type H+-transporting ATPase subunit delta
MAETRDPNAEHARTAAQIQADVGAEHVAEVYAKGLLGAAEAAGQTPTVLAELDEVLRSVLAPNPRFEAILASALIAHEEKAGMLDRVLGGRVSPLLLNFLKVVSRHGRLDCLRAIHRGAHGLYDQMRGRVAVRLTTAAPVSGALAGQIAATLREVLGGEPVVTQVTDPELIGGAVVRIGDTVYDGSIASQLRAIRQQISERSAHEIQSRRNRFCDPAGD